MLSKIKSSFKSYGFIQTILMCFRYLDNMFHTNKYGIYVLKKTQKHFVKKDKNVFVISDKLFSNNNEEESYVLCKKLNDVGYKVNYLYYGTNKINKINKYNPLSSYDYYNNYNLKKDDFVISMIDMKKLSKNIKAYYYKNKLLPRLTNHGISLSIVVLNYNNKNIIDKCLDSLIKYNNNYNYEIIVVDNQSIDGSYEQIKKKYKNIKLFKNTKNGCSSGRNLGVSKAKGEYIMFLDSDQFVTNDNWLDNYIEIVNNNDEIGAIGWAAGWFNRKGYSFHTVDNFTNRSMPNVALYRDDIGYLGSGGMILKKELFNAIEGFDEQYDPTCYEDTDISLKIRNHGKEIVYCPYLGIEHKAHQTTKSGTDGHLKLINNKGLYFVNKWKEINPDLLRYRK